MTRLTKKFEGHWVQHTKVWTPDRTRIEVEGPLPSHMGDFLVIALAAQHDAKFVKASQG
jgi:hypothetical protein